MKRAQKVLSECWDEFDGVPSFFIVAYSEKSAEVVSYGSKEERREVERRVRDAAHKAECIVFAGEMRFVTKTVPTGTPLESRAEMVEMVMNSQQHGIVMLVETREGIVTAMSEILETKAEDGTVRRSLSSDWRRVEGATLNAFFPPFFPSNRAN